MNGVNHSTNRKLQHHYRNQPLTFHFTVLPLFLLLSVYRSVSLSLPVSLPVSLSVSLSLAPPPAPHESPGGEQEKQQLLHLSVTKKNKLVIG